MKTEAEIEDVIKKICDREEKETLPAEKEFLRNARDVLDWVLGNTDTLDYIVEGKEY